MKIKIKEIFSVLLFLSCIMPAKAQITGDWNGILNVQGMEFEFIFHITNEDGNYSTTLDIPAQGVSKVALEINVTEENQLTIASKAGLRYKGALTGKIIVGTFEQDDLSLPLNLEKFEDKLPGDVSLPSSIEELATLASFDKGNFKYNEEDYFSNPKISQFRLSPNGKYMSYMEKEDGSPKRHVYVKNLATDQSLKIIEEKDNLISEYSWLNDKRLMYEMDNGGNEIYHIFAINIDGTNNVDLTPFEGVTTRVLCEPDNQNYIIISMNKNDKRLFEPYKLNILTGEITQLFENNDVDNPIQDYIFDKNGELRGYKIVKGFENQLYYKDLRTNKFRLVQTSNWGENFIFIAFNYTSNNKDEAYVATDLDSDKIRIVLYNFKNNRIIKEVFYNSDCEVSSIGFSRKRNYEIDYFTYEGDKDTIVPVSTFCKDMYQRIERAVPGKTCRIIDRDKDENVFLIAAQSDKLYGAYYCYDARNKTVTLLQNLMPQLKEEDMAEMRPISFKSRDGLTLHGYITLPASAIKGEKVPLIVNPHGGPHKIRDSWGFNPETQLFASRGYATLQVNFRISGGYGKEFLQAGFKQAGRKIMDDIEDGVKYVIEQGWADKDKIAIYGASHGGYATLMGMIKTPDLYACGVNYAGISNIFTFFNSFPEYWKPYKELMKKVWYDIDDIEEAKIAKEVSPVFQVDKIKAPLFVIQGANDPRVNINEADQIVESLRKRGFDVPYMVKYNEGHGFDREENKMDMYKCILGFFAKVFHSVQSDCTNRQ